MKKIGKLINFRQKKKEAEERELAQLERLSKSFKLNHVALKKEEQRIKDVRAGKVRSRSLKYDVEGIREKINKVVYEQEAKMPEVEKRIKVLKEKLNKEK